MFQHIAHIAQNLKPEQYSDFLIDIMELLDCWERSSTAEEQQRVFASCEHLNSLSPHLALWWFDREQRNPDLWPNSWPAEDFLRHMFDTTSACVFFPYALARMQWAVKRKEWEFFQAWAQHHNFVHAGSSRQSFIEYYSNQAADNSEFPEILQHIQENVPCVYDIVVHQLPTQYLQEHPTLPHAHDVVAQRMAVEVLMEKRKNFSSCALNTFAQWEKLLEHIYHPGQQLLSNINLVWCEYRTEMRAEDHLRLGRWMHQRWDKAFKDVFPLYDKLSKEAHSHWCKQWAEASMEMAPGHAHLFIQKEAAGTVNHVLAVGAEGDDIEDGIDMCIQQYQFLRSKDPHGLLNHPIALDYWDLLPFNLVALPPGEHTAQWQDKLAELDAVAPPGVVGAVEIVLNFLFNTTQQRHASALIATGKVDPFLAYGNLARGHYYLNWDHEEDFQLFLQKQRIGVAVGDHGAVSAARKI